MLAILDTAVVSGLRGELVRVEVDVAPGLPGCHIVGLPDAALSEARERVRSAIRNAGFAYPLSRITVNLAPADRRKHGAAYDVAIAVGILLASEQLRASGGPWALLGELSLDGAIMPVPGVLPMVSTLRDAGHHRICVPVRNRDEAGLVSGVEVVGAEGLDDVARLVAGPRGRNAATARRRAPIRMAVPTDPLGVGQEPGGTASERSASALTRPTDLADVRGQDHARWALEVAIAGRHNLLLLGSPGAGKTMLARCTPTLLPRLSESEAREVAVIRSVAGLEQTSEDRLTRPFLAPHHTTSYAALVGGGPLLRPGLVTQAHNSVRLEPLMQGHAAEGYSSLSENCAMAYDLERFLDAQEPVYERVLDEVRSGRKVSHWMWFIFPQLAGLGSSSMSQRYAIDSLEEARAYLAHPVLGARLRECAGLLLEDAGGSAEGILGPIDALKLRSCMTLCQRAAPEDLLFGLVLERFYGGVADDATDALLA